VCDSKTQAALALTPPAGDPAAGCDCEAPKFSGMIGRRPTGRKAVAVSVYSRALQRAAALLGGRARLCRHLRVPAAELDRWIADEAEPPRGIFLKVVDLIIDETPVPGDSDPGEPPAPRDASPGGDSSSTWR
jgi:hypothetical protein